MRFVPWRGSPQTILVLDFSKILSRVTLMDREEVAFSSWDCLLSSPIHMSHPENYHQQYKEQGACLDGLDIDSISSITVSQASLDVVLKFCEHWWCAQVIPASLDSRMAKNSCVCHLASLNTSWEFSLNKIKWGEMMNNRHRYSKS